MHRNEIQLYWASWIYSESSSFDQNVRKSNESIYECYRLSLIFAIISCCRWWKSLFGRKTNKFGNWKVSSKNRKVMEWRQKVRIDSHQKITRDLVLQWLDKDIRRISIIIGWRKRKIIIPENPQKTSWTIESKTHTNKSRWHYKDNICQQL